MNDYKTVKAEAQAYSDLTGTDTRVFKVYGGYSWGGLPAKKFRFGRDLEGEVVYPTRLDKTKPGHGPLA